MNKKHHLLVLLFCIFLFFSCGKAHKINKLDNFIPLTSFTNKKIAIYSDSYGKDKIISLSEDILKNKNYQIVSLQGQLSRIKASDAVNVAERMGADGIILIHLKNLKKETSKNIRVNGRSLQTYYCDASAELIDFKNNKTIWKISKKASAGDSLFGHIAKKNEIIPAAVDILFKNLPSSFELKEAELNFFVDCKAKNTIAAYESYLNRYPNGFYVDEAKSQIEPLLFEKVKSRDSIASYDRYLKEYPDGKFISQVKELREKKYFENIKKENALAGYDQYLKEYPSGTFVDQVQKLREKPAFENAKVENRLAGYNDYLRDYPDGNYVEEVIRLRERPAFEKARQENSIKAFDRYLKDYPNGNYVSQVRQLRQNRTHEIEEALKREEERDYQEAKKLDNHIIYERFLKNYPNGIYAEEVKKRSDDAYFREIKEKDTVEDYKQYFVRYSNGLHVDEVEKLLEIRRFKDTETTGSLSAYQQYLSDYPVGKFKEIVRDRIRLLEEYEQTQKCASERGNKACYKKLALIYRLGIGVPIQIEKSYDNYKIAQEKGVALNEEEKAFVSLMKRREYLLVKVASTLDRNKTRYSYSKVNYSMENDCILTQFLDQKDYNYIYLDKTYLEFTGTKWTFYGNWDHISFTSETKGIKSSGMGFHHDEYSAHEVSNIFNYLAQLYWVCRNAKSVEEFEHIKYTDDINILKTLAEKGYPITVGGLNAAERYKKLMQAEGRLSEAEKNMHVWKGKNKHKESYISSDIIYSARDNPKSVFSTMFKQFAEGMQKISGSTGYTDMATLNITAETGGFLSTTLDRFTVILEDEYGQKQTRSIDTGFFSGHNVDFYITQSGNYKIYVNGYSSSGNKAYSMQFEKYLSNSDDVYCTIYFKNKTAQFH